ncbi:MAG: hypothetical protein HYV18_03070 [Gammaproteobacteria bacterium]|nr:hypothetical protein [Gammaproteobacteria bacterium]
MRAAPAADEHESPPRRRSMAHTQILFRSEAREKILRGAARLADAVRITLGPKSKSVLIQKKWGAPIVCNDGVTIAKAVDLQDPEENLAARSSAAPSARSPTARPPPSSAVAEGIVAGGGLALLRATEAVARQEAQAEGDEKTGLQILRRALEAPARTIAENSAVDAGVVVARMLAEGGDIGFDAAAKQYVNMFEVGIIDPTKVARIALENAVSVASVLLLTEATITELPEREPKEPAEPGV